MYVKHSTEVQDTVLYDMMDRNLNLLNVQPQPSEQNIDPPVSIAYGYSYKTEYSIVANKRS